MSDTQTHFCKVNDFYWISNNYPSFFLFLPRKTPKIASFLPPFLLASSLACLLPAPVPPCPRSSLPPALPTSSLPPFPEVFFRAPAEGSLPRPPFLSSVLTVHNPQPPFCLHISCPYVSLSICAFWLSHFYSFTPSSLLSCPPIQYAYSCVLLFSPSFLSRLLIFMPLISRRQVTSRLQKKAVTVHLSIMSGLSGSSVPSVPISPRGVAAGGDG